MPLWWWSRGRIGIERVHFSGFGMHVIVRYE